MEYSKIFSIFLECLVRCIKFMYRVWSIMATMDHGHAVYLARPGIRVQGVWKLLVVLNPPPKIKNYQILTYILGK